MAQTTVKLSARDLGLVKLGVAVVIGADGKLPSEVRIFRAGVNDTEKGPYLFDDIAAQSTIEHFKAHGVRLMIDLEHLSLDEECANYDPDPRAWCGLAIKPAEQPTADAHYDCWLVNVEWLEDGVRRLSGKLQPYLSPAFPADDDRRIEFIRNVAMTAMPATHQAPALVAASSKGSPMNPKQLMALLAKLCPNVRLSSRATAVLLATAAEEPIESGGDAPSGKWASIVSAAADAVKALSMVPKAKDPDDALGAAQKAQEAVDAFEKAFSALSPGADKDAPATAPSAVPASAPAPAEDAATKALAARDRTELERLRGVAIEHEKLIAKQAAERLAVENGERRQLVGEMVTGGHETPATAWSDELGTVPAEPWASMPLEQLRARVEKLGGTRRVPRGAVAPAPEGGAVVQTNNTNVSEFEINRLRAVYDRENRHAPAGARRKFETCIEELAATKDRQVRHAAEKGNRAEAQRLSRPIKECDVLANASGRDLVTLASVAQLPIQAFGASSQRSLEEFRLEFNSTLVSLPIPWAEDLGIVLPGGGLKDTYPLAFYAIKYREILGQNPNAVTPNSVDVSVTKRPFGAAAQANLRRLTQAGPDGRGDFAYIQTWQQNAAQMARARVNLRNHLIADLLESSSPGGGLATWGVTPERPGGVDGANFFSASHKVNPFDPKMKLHGVATWSNLSAAGGTALPLSAANLTAAKALMLNVAGPDGEEMGASATGLLNPTVLKEPARLLLTVQDLILRAGTVDGVANAFGAVKNEHYQSGFEAIWGPQLAGTSATANWYLFSREIISRGMPPWVLAEDAAEEIRTWDESSDFYKDSGEIKIGSYLHCAAALLYPQGIRLQYGA